jgi:hypothetical protein
LNVLDPEEQEHHGEHHPAARHRATSHRPMPFVHRGSRERPGADAEHEIPQRDGPRKPVPGIPHDDRQVDREQDKEHASQVAVAVGVAVGSQSPGLRRRSFAR